MYDVGQYVLRENQSRLHLQLSDAIYQLLTECNTSLELLFREFIHLNVNVESCETKQTYVLRGQVQRPRVFRQFPYKYLSHPLTRVGNGSSQLVPLIIGESLVAFSVSAYI